LMFVMLIIVILAAIAIPFIRHKHKRQVDGSYKCDELCCFQSNHLSP
jgi:competence protein ComGC